MASARNAIAIAVLLVCAACAGSTPPEDSGQGRLVIATTVAPITSIVANIASGYASIAGLVPEGTNSHTFDPPPSAATLLSRADVLFYNGLKLEDPTRELAEQNMQPDARRVALGDLTIGPEDYVFDFSFPKEGGKPNPHLWTNPPYAKRYAEIVAETLADMDPDNAGVYRSRTQVYIERLDRLDTALREATATVDPAKRKLLTYHDSFAYFARDYGWTVVGAIQASSFEDPTPREVARIIEQIRAEEVPAIFGSEVFPSPVLEQIARETGARYVDALRDDDLPGEPGDAEHTFLSLLRFDYATIVEALGGDAASLGAVDVTDVVRDEADYPQ